MSQGVHAALEAALGAEALLTLLEDGRYRRDVY
jgi:sulfite reductase (NADPH) flavoprotein alpha-component